MTFSFKKLSPLRATLALALVLFFSFLVSSRAQENPPEPPPPETVAATGGGGDFYVSGNSNRITLELKGVDIIDVLKVLSKKSGLNIIAGKNVRGQVTLFLQDVDVMEALRVILVTSELAFEEENGIIKVMSQRDYEAIYGKPYEDKRETEVVKLQYTDAQTVGLMAMELKTNIGKIVVNDRSNSLVLIDVPSAIKNMKKAIKNVDQPAVAKIFTLKYSDVEEIESKVTEMLTPASGSVKADKRSNRLSVIDYPEKIRQIEKMIEAFDVKPQQVLIQAKIVNVTLNDDYAFGIDWDLILEHTEDGKVTFDGNDFGGISKFGTGPLSANKFTTFTINSTGDDFFAVISALEGMGKTNTLSSPRLSVLNGEEATLSVATSQPYVSQTVVQGDTTSTTADNIEFVDVGVILKVKPKITEDRRILLKVKPQVSSLAANSPFVINQFDDSGTVVGTRASVPIVTKQEVETTVLVSTGRTVVIGGLIQDTESKISRKVPMLGDIPLIGKAFRHETVDNTKDELVLFLSPTILDSEVEAEEEQKKYLTKNERLLDFNKVGSETYDYDATERNSLTPWRERQMPFWKKKEQEMDAQVEALLKAKVNLDKFPMPANSFTSNLSTTVPAGNRSPAVSAAARPATREAYQAALATMIRAALQSDSEVQKYVGKSGKILLYVFKDGKVDSVGFPRTGSLADNDVREKITEVINNISPFPAFPSSISSSKEKFEVQISL